MFDNHQDAERFISDTYDLKLQYLDEESVSVSDGVTVIENGVETYNDIKGGTYTYYDFKGGNDIIYKLVYFPDESIGNDRLIQMVQDEELRDIKEWEELPQKIENKNYILYKLVPYTVQGVPTYS